jgi:hypothetical protein
VGVRNDHRDTHRAQSCRSCRGRAAAKKPAESGSSRLIQQGLLPDQIGVAAQAPLGADVILIDVASAIRAEVACARWMQLDFDGLERLRLTKP